MKHKLQAPKTAKKEKEKESSSVNSATDDDLDDALVLYVDSLIESQIPDSGASFYSIASKKLMRNFMAQESGKVYLADDKPLDIKSKGDVQIKPSNSCKWLLQ